LLTLVGDDPIAFRDSFIALVIAALASLVAGLTLAAGTGTLEELPGLLLLVPAAIAVKGNIFGAVGSRLGTSIHAGTFRFTPRLDSVVGVNASVAVALSLVISVVLAVMAKGVASAFDISPTMSVADFIVVSTVGGMLASLVVLVITLALAAGSVRFGWDLDNVVAPLVTATADVVSLPALVISADLAGVDVLTPTLAWISVVGSVVALLWSLRNRLGEIVRIARESIPILTIAGLLDLLAGITVERRLDDFLTYPVLLILLPGFLGTAGALGGVLSSRLATKLHLGLVAPRPLPNAAAGRDIAMIFTLSIPVFAVLGLVAQLGGDLTNSASPGGVDILAVAMLGGMMATVFVVLVAYYGTIVAVRFGLDPDTYGIPMVTSSLDLIGAFTLIFAVAAVGVT
jgi:mgtE-like transporter